MKQIALYISIFYLSILNAQDQSSVQEQNITQDQSNAQEQIVAQEQNYTQEQSKLIIEKNSEKDIQNQMINLSVDEVEMNQKLSEINQLKLENERLEKLIETNKEVNTKKEFDKIEASSEKLAEENNPIIVSKSVEKIALLIEKNAEAESTKRNLINENNDKRRDLAVKHKEILKSKKEFGIKNRELEKELRIEKAKNKKLKQVDKTSI